MDCPYEDVDRFVIPIWAHEILLVQKLPEIS